MADWIPLGVSQEESNALVDGIPSYMESSLLDWLNSAEMLLCGGYAFSRRPEGRLRHRLINRFDRQIRQLSELDGSDIYEAASEMEELGNVYLQYTDFLIHELCNMRGMQYNLSALEAVDVSKIEPCLDELESILAESGSRWKVGVRNGYEGLEERVDSTMQAMADEVMDDPNELSGQLLSKSWHAVFGQNPDYSLAYATAIKAVEAITLPEISPNDSKATLSKAAQVMRGQKWGFELEPNPAGKVDGGIAQVVMNAMMNSQPDRHGGTASVEDIEVSKERAEAAVYSAVYLIQCFKSGLVLKPKKDE